MSLLLDIHQAVTEDVCFDGHSFSVLRLDKIHPVTGGNKWFKLQKNLEKYKQEGYAGILSFGGPFSNHIAALAAACNQEGIPSVGVIRGEEVQPLNVTLSRAVRDGMQLRFVPRGEYRLLRNPVYQEMLLQDFPGYLIIPEGGSNAEGVEGCGQIAERAGGEITDVMVAVGTGATYAGIRRKLPGHIRLWGIKVLEANQEQLVEKFSGHDCDSYLLPEYTFGGYARPSDPLQQFVMLWNRSMPVPIEPIYTGRLFFAAVDLLKKGFFGENPRLLVIHSGGMQYLGD